MYAAYRMLQEAADFLVDQCVGELESFNLRTPTAIRRALYSAARARLMTEVAQGERTQASELLETLPYLLQQRLLFGCSPDLARGIETPAEVEMRASTSSSSTGVAPPAAEPPASAPTSAEGSQSTRRRCDAGPRVPAPGSAPERPASPVRAQRLPSRDVGLPLQVALEAVTDDIAQEAVAATTAFLMQPPPTRPPPAGLRFLPGGHFLWNELTARPAGPVCRTHGEAHVTQLQAGKWHTLQKWAELGGRIVWHNREQGAAAFSDTLHQFIGCRRNLLRRVSSLRDGRPPWAHQVQDGAWVYAELHEAPADEDRLHGFHGSSMHALERSMAQGLESGWSGLTRNRVEHLGIYFHIERRARLCHNYVMYSALDDTGFLVAPVVHLSAPRIDPQGRKVSFPDCTEPQNMTYPDVVRMHGVWFHIMHVLQFWSGSGDNWVYAEPRFARSLEVDPTPSRAEIERMSREAAREQAGNHVPA